MLDLCVMYFSNRDWSLLKEGLEFVPIGIGVCSNRNWSLVNQSMKEIVNTENGGIGQVTSQTPVECKKKMCKVSQVKDGKELGCESLLCQVWTPDAFGPHRRPSQKPLNL